MRLIYAYLFEIIENGESSPVGRSRWRLPFAGAWVGRVATQTSRFVTLRPAPSSTAPSGSSRLGSAMYIRSKGYGVRLHTDGKPAQVRDTGFNVRDFSVQPVVVTDRRVASQSGNPRIIVRCIAACADRVLLCARADEPRRGRWNMPGGFLENGEEPHSAVIREAAEEAGAAIVPLRLAFIHEFPQLNEVVLTYLAEAPEKQLKLGTE